MRTCKTLEVSSASRRLFVPYSAYDAASFTEAVIFLSESAPRRARVNTSKRDPVCRQQACRRVLPTREGRGSIQDGGDTRPVCAGVARTEPRCHGRGRDGARGRAPQEAHLPQVPVPRRRAREASRPEPRGVRPAHPRARAPPHLPRAQGKAQALRSQIAPGEKGLRAHGQARAREDAPERHGRRARDDRQRRGRLQRQGIQRHRGQARDGRPLPRRILDHVQARAPRAAGHRLDELLALYPPEVRAKPYSYLNSGLLWQSRHVYIVSPAPRRPPRSVFSLVLSPPFGPDASHAHQGGSRAHPCHDPRVVGSWARGNTLLLQPLSRVYSARAQQ